MSILPLLLCLALGRGMQPPFDYDLHPFLLAGTNDRVMICFHGYGDNYQIAHSLRNLEGMEASLISFNFPEYDIKNARAYDPKKATFGTIHELLPALYVMKEVIVTNHLEAVDLYGFSAGGGALINSLAVLNTSTYDKELLKIGIKGEEKRKMLSAIQKGLLILDTPLKSIEEIIASRGSSEEFELLAKNYRENDLRPIDSLKKLGGLSLDILLHFQEKDEILSNRDDALYIERLKSHQRGGKVTVVMGDDGGHGSPHFSLWRAYSRFNLK